MCIRDRSGNFILTYNGIVQSATSLANNTGSQVIQINIPADGKTGELIGYFVNEVSCADTMLLKAPAPCPSANATLDCSNTISGTAFKDLNIDGQNNDNNGGIQGIKVVAYDCNNNPIDSAYTDAEGEYNLSNTCLLYTSPSPRDRTRSRMPSSA